MTKNKIEQLNIWMGARIKLLRLSAGMTQKELVRRLGITNMGLINVEAGIQTITNRMLFNISLILKVHISEFFPGVDKEGNYITQEEFEKLVKSYPDEYSLTPPFRIKTLEELENDRIKRENEALIARQLKEENKKISLQKKAERQLIKAENDKRRMDKLLKKVSKNSVTGSITRQLV